MRVSDLTDAMSPDQDWVAVDSKGRPLDVEILPDWGPAVLLASPVTDAAKRVGGGAVVESLDRSQLLSVNGFVLNRIVLLRLEDVEFDPRRLFDAVKGLRLAWQVVMTPVSPRSSAP